MTAVGVPKARGTEAGSRFFLRHVALVDDDPAARVLLEGHLASLQCRVSSFEGASAALAHLGRDEVHLVISDAVMPEMDGFELCRRLKRDEVLRYIPVILVTALDARADMVRGLEAGADDFLVKPVDPLVLRARVQAMLRVQSQYAELATAVPPAAAPLSEERTLESLFQERLERVATDAGLSAREREVLNLLLLGRRNDEIGLALGITARTAKFHQARILEKLGADSRMDLLRIFL